MADARSQPGRSVALAIAEDHFTTAARVERFATGHRHYVFDAVSESGAKAVVRISRRRDVAVVEDALYWSDRLRRLGVPLPEVLAADTSLRRHAFPYMILERFPGRDLADEIDRFSPAQIRVLARKLAAVQTIVSGLPPGRGFGFTPRLDGPFPNATWGETVRASLERSRRRLRSGDVLNESLADRVERGAEPLAGYFSSVLPTPFLHDITTKNVIVDRGELTGIVDVDDLCFGDPYFLLGLIRTALLAHGSEATYVDAWLAVLEPDAAQLAALDFYTALFCLDFLAEIGQRFNREERIAADRTYVARLLGLMDRHLRLGASVRP